ncbi:hypothetical protein [Streptomyces sp. NPDC004528]|uniref:hypothetical protein n=1 Tax=Streptomyces sp. NPDC004528 TaxID=3154550 RepID=UPI0033A10D78
MTGTREPMRYKARQLWKVGCALVAEPAPGQGVFRLTVTNESDRAVRRWAVSFSLPAGTHAHGEGTEFDIHPEASKAHGLPELFEVDCLGDVCLCSATWRLPPGEQAAITVTVHSGNTRERPDAPQGFGVFA